MSAANDLYSTSWELAVSVAVDASPGRVYGLVSDITRMGEWSPECVGGAWVTGTAGEVGARFHGYNRDGDAAWTSESEVIAASNPRSFGFSVLRFRGGGPEDNAEWSPDGNQVGDMTWTFDIEENGGGCVLTQRHVMRAITPFYRALLERVPESERPAHVQNRKEHLQEAMATTLNRIKAKAEGVA
ncbi:MULTISPECIES: SRPBCC family protein [Saccharopolyspora]|uniref:SRPBCC family protein n=1 Tax=Saccharopolyspora TaxID=1835 RepID=UPI0033CCDDFB